MHYISTKLCYQTVLHLRNIKSKRCWVLNDVVSCVLFVFDSRYCFRQQLHVLNVISYFTDGIKTKPNKIQQIVGIFNSMHQYNVTAHAQLVGQPTNSPNSLRWKVEIKLQMRNVLRTELNCCYDFLELYSLQKNFNII